MLQVLHLFGFLPNMLEWTGNPCVQGCRYCYAKMWKPECEPLEKLVNFILKKQDQDGLLAFLIRNRSAVSISNRSDIMCAPDWRERLSALKTMGFPIYLETKLNKDYKDLAQILDKDKDTIYQTVTGFNNKYEETNLLSADEKIEAAKWFNEQGFHHVLAVNPYLPDKCSVDDIKRMIDTVKPHGFVMRDYHKPSSGLMKQYYMAEYPKEQMKAARDAVRAYCLEKNIDHDIDLFGQDMPFYEKNNLRSADNKRSFGGKHFIKQEFAVYVQKVIDEDDSFDHALISFDGMLKFFARQIDYFKDCYIKPGEYNIHTGASYKKQTGNIGIIDFLRAHWNDNWFKDSFDKTKEVDENGNMIYYRHRNGFDKFVGGKK